MILAAGRRQDTPIRRWIDHLQGREMGSIGVGISIVLIGIRGIIHIQHERVAHARLIEPVVEGQPPRLRRKESTGNIIAQGEFQIGIRRIRSREPFGDKGITWSRGRRLARRIERHYMVDRIETHRIVQQILQRLFHDHW